MRDNYYSVKLKACNNNLVELNQNTENILE